MKTKIVLIFLLMKLCMSCNNSETIEAENRNLKLLGKWEWNKSTGGINGATLTPLSTNKNIILEIETNKIKFIENGTLIFEKGYNIQTQQSIFGGQKQLIIYEQSSIARQSFEISENKLVLNEECTDCYSKLYTKL